MSNEHQKADQIAHRFYTKLALVVNDARATPEPRTSTKVDKWFNLETPDSDLFKEQLRVYKTVSTSPTPPQFELQVVLSIPDLTHNQVLVHLYPNGFRTRIDPTPRYIVLESWFLTFTPSHLLRGDTYAHSDVAPPTIYKHGISLFRSIFTLLRMLPAWKFYKRLRRRTDRNGNLSIQLRVAPIEESSTDTLKFDDPPAANTPPLNHDVYSFPPVPHPTGLLRIRTQFLISAIFQLDELESLLSSRFLSIDEGPDFTPTLVKNQQRDSLSSSPASLPIRIALPRSPPVISSIADRFVAPAVHTRTTSLPGSMPSTKVFPPPMSRQVSGGGPDSTSRISVASSSGRQDAGSTWSKDEAKLTSGLPSRLRKESGRGGSDLPSSPGPLPIRRPSINPVHPFKSSTLSTGSPSVPSPPLSLRNPSPLSSTHSRPVQISPLVPPSPIGIGSRPSPPFAPSSLGDRRSLASAEGDEQPRPQGRKRYSSSFGHRYAAVGGGAGSEGSAGSGERRDIERPGSASFLSTNTDDDDISAFVQDIDSRKPLNGHDRLSDQIDDSHDRKVSIEAAAGVDTDLTPSGDGRSSRAGGMLTSESEVDEKLRQMNAAFLASLEGLGGHRRTTSEQSGRGDAEGNQSTHSAARGCGIRPRLRLRPGSRAETPTGLGGTSSEEVIGRMSLDEDTRRRSPAL